MEDIPVLFHGGFNCGLCNGTRSVAPLYVPVELGFMFFVIILDDFISWLGEGWLLFV
jgi:hypothetical protein